MALRKKTWRKLGIKARETRGLVSAAIGRTVATRYARWRDRGFLPEEAWQFKKLGRDGMQAPYIKAMIADRAKLRAEWEASGGNLRDYRKMVAQDYRDKKIPGWRGLFGFRKVGVWRDDLIWDLFKWYQRNCSDPNWISPTPDELKTIKQKERKHQVSRLGMHKVKKDHWQTEMDKALARMDRGGSARDWNKAVRYRDYHQAKIERLDRELK